MSIDRDRSICVLGLGYVGLTLAVVMAEQGFRVTGVEINPATLALLRSARPQFQESGLSVRLRNVMQTGGLRISDTIAQDDGEGRPTVFIISVGTPLGPDGEPRLDMVAAVARDIAGAMPPGALVVLRSTVVIGTTRSLVLPILQSSGKPFQLAFAPERTIEGKALEELRTVPQIVGGLTVDDAWRASVLFSQLTPTTIRVSSLETAEVIKLLDNSYRDVFFAFGNEAALLCEAIGIDAIEVIQAANTGYPRTNIAVPGFVGGPCLEKDPHILAHSLAPYGFAPRLVNTGRQINEELPGWVIDNAAMDIQPDRMPTRPIISVCGLAFKGRPETDDVRGTPSKILIDRLKELFPSAVLRGQDFAVRDEVIRSLGVEPTSIDGAFRGANLVITANNNARYQSLDCSELFATMGEPALVYDVWGVLDGMQASVKGKTVYRRLGSAAALRAVDV